MTELTDDADERPAAIAAVRSAAHIAGLNDGTGHATAGTGFVLAGAAICFIIAMGPTLSIPILLTLTQLADYDDAVGATWATFLPMITGAAFAPVFSRLSDLYGRRRIIVICLAVALVGSIIGPLGVGQDRETITTCIGRALQGAGIAAIPIVLASAREMLSPKRMISAIAIFGGTLGMGGVLGAPAGQFIYQTVGWKPMFWGNAVAMGLLIAATLASMPMQHPRLRPRFDYRGAMLLTPAVLILLTVSMQAGGWGRESVPTLVGLGVGLTLLVIWTITALRTRSPLVNLRSFRHPSVVFAHLSSFALGWLVLTNTLLVAIQVQNENVASGHTWEPSATILVALPSIAAVLFVAPCAAVIAQRFGPKNLLTTGALLALCGFVMRVYASPSSAIGIVWATVISIGAALATTALPMILNLVASAQRIGALHGMNWMLRVCGMSVGAAVVIDIATDFTVRAGGSAAPTWQAMWIVLVLSALVSVVLVLFAVLLPMPHRAKAAPLPR